MDNENWKARFLDYQIAAHRTVGREAAERIWREYEQIRDSVKPVKEQIELTEIELEEEQ